MTIEVKTIQDENFVDYKEPSMFIAFPKCSFKCEKECGVSCCQNSYLAKEKNILVNEYELIKRYLNNDITKSIVFGGLEPFDSYEDLYHIIYLLRRLCRCDDTIVIYTGYNRNEIENKVNQLKSFPNIIIKYGRFIPNQDKHFDEILGVYLASDNQYAERI